MKAAIYARLSREDEEKIDGNNESRSIENQIKTLTNYANEHHFEIINIYYDDGYSGSNMDRPGFQQMLNDAKNKVFNVLLIKDLSRLGRKLYQVGTLVEKTLPQMGIRLIAINDNYDATTYKDDESVVLRNFLNDYYLKEFRRKCRASLAHRVQTIHINYYPKYGYIYDSEGTEQIDPYASDIVKLIFELSISFSSNLLPSFRYINSPSCTHGEISSILTSKLKIETSILAFLIRGWLFNNSYFSFLFTLKIYVFSVKNIMSNTSSFERK